MKSTDFLVRLTTPDGNSRTLEWSSVRGISLDKNEVTIWTGDESDETFLIVSEQYDELCVAWNDYLEMVFKAQFAQAFGA